MFSDRIIILVFIMPSLVLISPPPAKNPFHRNNSELSISISIDRSTIIM